MVPLLQHQNDMIAAWFDYCMWFYLQNKFSGPARMIARGADMEEFMKQFTLNGMKPFNMCKPY